MISYSAPLILANVSYWIISGSDKYITNALMGASANGLLSVVHKIPSLCTIAFSVFYEAFILSSLSEHKLTEDTYNQDKAFYQKGLDWVMAVLAVLMAFVCLLSYPIVLLYSKDFLGAWPYVAMYTFGVALGAGRNYYSALYMAKGKTVTLTWVIALGALINAASCFLLMRFTDLGLWAACISTVLANLFVLVYYYFDSRKIVKISMSWRTFLSLLMCLATSAIPLFFSEPWVFLVSSGVLVLFVLLLQAPALIQIAKSLFSRKRQEKNVDSPR